MSATLQYVGLPYTIYMPARENLIRLKMSVQFPRTLYNIFLRNELYSQECSGSLWTEKQKSRN